MKLTLFALFLTVFSLDLAAEENCPSQIYYSNGNTLKGGNNFYYPNGNTFVAGANAYYSNGNTFKGGDSLYYRNGNTLKGGANLYYPNGNTLKGGVNFYYPNGNTLKGGSNFYYPNGNTARGGTQLYDPNGNATVFPIQLGAPIGEIGSFQFNVGSTTETLTLDLNRVFQEISVSLTGVDVDGNHIEFQMTDGNPQHHIYLVIGPQGLQKCEIAGVPLTEFSLSGTAATLQVKVAPGYDSQKVRDVLQSALDSLGLK